MLEVKGDGEEAVGAFSPRGKQSKDDEDGEVQDMTNRKETEPESEPADVIVQASDSVSQDYLQLILHVYGRCGIPFAFHLKHSNLL